jgi:peptidyl-prolyl cis-trans isomerase C
LSIGHCGLVPSKIHPNSAIAKGERLRDCPDSFRREGGRCIISYKDRVMTSLNSAFHRKPASPSPVRRGRALATVAALALLALPVVSGCSKDSASSASTAAQADPNDTLLARVNGVEIRQSDINIAEEDINNEQLHAAPPEVKREQLLAYLTDVILISQSAEKKNLANDDDFKRRLQFQRNKLLMASLMQNQAKTSASEEEMRKVYDEAVKPMATEEEVHARHILVESEEEAKAIAAELSAGGDFATIAKEKSKDPGSADGGDLGYFAKGQMVPEFSEVAFKMFPGQVSNPVKTQFGWHIIKVEDKRQRPVPEYDKVKEQIAAYVARRSQNELVTQLREGAKIERLDRPATPPSPPASPPTTPGGAMKK